MHEEFQRRLVKEYRYAVTKMQEVTQLSQKLFYFSVFFGDARRILNLEWNRELVLIHLVTQHIHTQINTSVQTPSGLSLDLQGHFQKLTQVSSELATYFEKAEEEGSTEELCQILGHLAEIGYSFTGNGSYLYEKGVFKL